MQFDIKVDTKEVEAALTKMQQRALNMRPFMMAVGMVMIKSTHENFESDGRPKWKGWSPFTQKIYEGNALDHAIGRGLKSGRKTSKGKASFISRQYQKNLAGLGARKILQNTGKLKKSVRIGKLTNNMVEVGSDLIYSRIHQVGGVIKPKKAKALAVPIGGGRILKLKSVTMPARPYLQLQKTDYETIIRIAEDYLARGRIG